MNGKWREVVCLGLEDQDAPTVRHRHHELVMVVVMMMMKVAITGRGLRDSPPTMYIGQEKTKALTYSISIVAKLNIHIASCRSRSRLASSCAPARTEQEVSITAAGPQSRTTGR